MINQERTCVKLVTLGNQFDPRATPPGEGPPDKATLQNLVALGFMAK